MSVDDALKYIISMGVVAPPPLPAPPPSIPGGPTESINAPVGQACSVFQNKRTHHANSILRPRLRRLSRPDRHPLRLGPSPARPRRRDLHRPARPRRPRAGRLRSRPGRDVPGGRVRPQRVRPEDHRQGPPPPRRHRERRPCPGEIEVLCHDIEVLNASATPPFQLDDENLSETTRRPTASSTCVARRCRRT